MKVMTFNIQHGLDYQNQIIDLPLFAEYIKRQEVDFCALNEVRGAGNWEGYTDQTNALGDALGYNRFFGEAIKVVGSNPYGNAFLTRYPVKSAEVIHIPDSDDRSEDVHYEHRCAIKAVVDVNGKDVMFIVCHIGLAKAEAKNAVDTLCAILDSNDLPAVVMGDFNHTKESGALNALLKRLCDTDDSSKVPGIYTFPSYSPREKIDYILFRGMRCLSCETLEEIVSDHYPIVAELTIE
ncbi:MAG: endonuclease/exonuclease/phosphatase family protein [Clostridia bacterium]|nr:endonuclease/exonuclease/phosphatase family protein [Clostridia bacterium]